MRWLLDTCALSESTHLRPHPGVQEWLMRHGDDCVISAASLGEIQYGVACLRPGVKRNQLHAWALALAQRFEGRVLATDAAVWRQFGDLKASLRAIGRMQDGLDMVIAATALQHGLTLVTRNTRRFEDTGIRLVNPWADDSSA